MLWCLARLLVGHFVMMQFRYTAMSWRTPGALLVLRMFVRYGMISRTCHDRRRSTVAL